MFSAPSLPPPSLSLSLALSFSVSLSLSPSLSSGVQPSVFLCASFGKIAKDAIHAGKEFSLSKGFESVAILFFLQFVVLLPAFYKKQMDAVLGITDAPAGARKR